MKMQGKITALIMALVLSQTLIQPCFAVGGQGDAGQTAGASQSGAASQTSYNSQLPSYLNYLSTVEQIYPQQSVPVLTETVSLAQGQYWEQTVQVEQAGLYALKMTYQVEESLSQYPAISVEINGEIPYREASSIHLMRRWQDAQISTGPLTTAVIPEQKELLEDQTVYLHDTVKYYGGLLCFSLRQGQNTLRIYQDTENVSIKEITFENPRAVPSYEQAESRLTAPVYSGDPIYIEGENARFKSDASLYPLNDASSAAVSPSSPYEKYLNVIGGSNWKNIGQYIEWEVDVPQDGLYHIAVKYRQSVNIGMTSFRRILIDGQVPYQELEEVSFPYSGSYQNRVLTADDKPMLFHLTKGKHIIRMEVVVGELNQVLPHVEDVVVALNTAYRQIIMITGSNPDTLRDYRLEDSIPDTIASLETQRQALDALSKQIFDITGGGSSGTKIMGTVCSQLEEFVEDPYNLTSSLPDFKSNISSLSTWLLDAKSQPLSVDYIALYGGQEEPRPAKAGFFDSVRFHFLSFLHTFSQDYQSLSKDQDTLTVWMSAGATQHTIMKQLVDGAFHQQNSDIRVDVKLVTSSLLTAIISGKAPDVAIGVNNNDVMNFAFRNAVADMSDFPDFPEVAQRFRPSAMVPVSFDESTYALPETQNYEMLFYRSDVLEELGVDIPETWEDVISAMAALKKKNLEFGIPSAINSYLTLLFQRGGDLYNPDRTASAVTTYDSIDAFTTFCSWFTEYKSPITFDGLQRFRTGEMPLLVAGYQMYNNIDILAPEIKGLWGVTMMPGTPGEDGSLNRSVAAEGTYCVILNQQKADAAWEFSKWWTSAETQLAYAQRLEMALGQSARYNTANLQAFDNLGYTSQVKELIKAQGEQSVGIPSVPGGYYVSRYISNALNKVLYQGEIPGDALIGFAKTIDKEIAYKREEFGMNK